MRARVAGRGPCSHWLGCLEGCLRERHQRPGRVDVVARADGLPQSCDAAASLGAHARSHQQRQAQARDAASRLHQDNRNLGPGVVVAKDQLDGHAAVWLRLAEKQIDVIGGHTLAPM